MGLYDLRSDEKDPSLLRVGSGDPEALQAAADGITLVDGGEEPEHVAPGWLRADRVIVAEWVAHEVRNYVTYTDLDWMKQ